MFISSSYQEVASCFGLGLTLMTSSWGFPGGLAIRNPPPLQVWIRSPGQADPLDKEMATHPSILAWEIPWTQEPGATFHGVAESDMTERLNKTEMTSSYLNYLFKDPLSEYNHVLWYLRLRLQHKN